jgi:hypothetical protein
MLVVEKAAILLGGKELVDTEGAQRQVVGRHRHRPLSLRLMLLVIYRLLGVHLASRRVALSTWREPWRGAFIFRFHLDLDLQERRDRVGAKWQVRSTSVEDCRGTNARRLAVLRLLVVCCKMKKPVFPRASHPAVAPPSLHRTPK